MIKQKIALGKIEYIRISLEKLAIALQCPMFVMTFKIN